MLFGTTNLSCTPSAFSSLEYKVTEDTSTYVLNVKTHKFHMPTCASIRLMNDVNKLESSESRDVLISQGYSPCKNCNP